MAPTSERNWMPGIEALRGVAAVSVVIHHTWSLSNQPHFHGYEIIEGFGSWGVTLFFLLSGFLLSEYFWQEKHQRPVSAYFIRRGMRILPAYYINLTLLFLFFASHALLFSRQGLKQVGANLTLTHYLWPATASSLNVNGALWTLTLELCLYACMPLLAWSVRRFGYRAVATFICAGLGYKFVTAYKGARLVNLYFDPRDGANPYIARLFVARQFFGILPIFAVGIGLRWFTFRQQSTPKKQVSVPVLLALLTPSVIALNFIERASNYQHWVWFTTYDFVIAALATPALYYAATRRSPVGSAASTVRYSMRITDWAGKRSFGMYLWHFPVILSVYGRGSALTPPDMTDWVPKVLLIFILTALLGHISYTLIEIPGQNLGRKFVHRLSSQRRSEPHVPLSAVP